VRDRGMETMPGLDVRLGKERPRNRARVSTRARCTQSSKARVAGRIGGPAELPHGNPHSSESNAAHGCGYG
jgi:hypothetical protein